MKWMISCQVATELLSKSLDTPLSLKESILLKTHMFMCEHCREYGQQFHFFRNCLNATPPKIDVSLSEECKQEIKKALKESQALS